MSNAPVPMENLNVSKISDSAPHAESLSQSIQSNREAERSANAQISNDISTQASHADKYLPHISLAQKQEAIKELEKMADKNQAAGKLEPADPALASIAAKATGLPDLATRNAELKALEKMADKNNASGELMPVGKVAMHQGLE